MGRGSCSPPRAPQTPPSPPPPPPRPSDVSVSTVGVQTWTSSALGTTDLDLTVGERLRWTLAGADERGGTDVLLLADLRTTLDASGPLFEWVALRQLAVPAGSRCSPWWPRSTSR